MTAESQLDHDLEIISNSLRMLPPWQDCEWWRQFSQETGQTLEYLKKKLAWITTGWQAASSDKFDFADDRAIYVIKFFDNPALYEHLDAVQPGLGEHAVGRVGRRWVEEICAAAWRLIAALEPYNGNSNNFSVSD
jgi:hypothetical protein